MWEKITELEKGVYKNCEVYSERMKVPGGWIIRSIASGHDTGTSVHQVFIPDLNHQWQLN